ncbi:MAG TPA: chemotaxis protein CheX [Phycisphaerales bacterium]|nr:chemotaxis protein CheX [Phycisphaerales bacterium]
MDPQFITPFIKSIQNVFSTMMQLQVNVGDPRLKTEPLPAYDVSGIIGMSGDVVGSIVLSFTTDTAMSLVALFSGQKLEAGHPDFADAVGELVNMVSGNAKGQFPGNKRVSISCPTVVVGKNHQVARQKDIPCVMIPCATDCGEVVIEIAIRPAEAGEKSPQPLTAGAGA